MLCYVALDYVMLQCITLHYYPSAKRHVGYCDHQHLSVSSLATYGGIHISFGHITAQVRNLGISCQFSFVHFISFHTLGGLRAFRKPFSI